MAIVVDHWRLPDRTPAQIRADREAWADRQAELWASWDLRRPQVTAPHDYDEPAWWALMLVGAAGSGALLALVSLFPGGTP